MRINLNLSIYQCLCAKAKLSRFFFFCSHQFLASFLCNFGSSAGSLSNVPRCFFLRKSFAADNVNLIRKLFVLVGSWLGDVCCIVSFSFSTK